MAGIFFKKEHGCAYFDIFWAYNFDQNFDNFQAEGLNTDAKRL